MIVSTYEHFSPVGDTDSLFCSRQYLSKHIRMGDQRVWDLQVTWPDAVIYTVDMLGRHDIKF